MSTFQDPTSKRPPPPGPFKSDPFRELFVTGRVLHKWVVRSLGRVAESKRSAARLTLADPGCGRQPFRALA